MRRKFPGRDERVTKTILEELGCAVRPGERWLMGLLEQSRDGAASFCSASEARAPGAGYPSPAADRGHSGRSPAGPLQRGCTFIPHRAVTTRRPAVQRDEPIPGRGSRAWVRAAIGGVHRRARLRRAWPQSRCQARGCQATPGCLPSGGEGWGAGLEARLPHPPWPSAARAPC